MAKDVRQRSRLRRLDPLTQAGGAAAENPAPVAPCEIVSSEPGDPDLEQRLVQRILPFRFESKGVGPITTTKPIDFFPA